MGAHSKIVVKYDPVTKKSTTNHFKTVYHYLLNEKLSNIDLSKVNESDIIQILKILNKPISKKSLLK